MSLYGKLIYALEQNGFCNNDEDESLRPFNDNYCDVETFIKDFMEKQNVSAQTNMTDAFDSPAFNVSVLAVAWLDDELHLDTFLVI